MLNIAGGILFSRVGCDDGDVDEDEEEGKRDIRRTSSLRQGCQMAKLDPFLSLDCARVECVVAQSKERKVSNFAA